MKIESSSGFGFSCRYLVSQRTQPLLFRNLTSDMDRFLDIVFQVQQSFAKWSFFFFCGQGRSNSYFLEINPPNSSLKIDGQIKNCSHNADINLR